MDLERELRSLRVDWPATPAFALERRRRRPLAVAVAVTLAAIGIAFAVPQSRSSILRFFGLGSVHVQVVGTLPRAAERPLEDGLGRVISLPAARGVVPGLLLPAGVATQRLHVLRDDILSLVVGYRGRPVLLSEIPGGGGVYLKKLAGGSTSIEEVSVGGAPGLWLSGGPHVLFTPQRSPRLAGNVLVWQAGDTTYRLESRTLRKADAVAIAESLRRG